MKTEIYKCDMCNRESLPGPVKVGLHYSGHGTKETDYPEGWKAASADHAPDHHLCDRCSPFLRYWDEYGNGGGYFDPEKARELFREFKKIRFVVRLMERGP